MDEEQKTTKLKMYPNSYEVEQSLLCCMLIGGDVATNIAPIIPEDLFYNPRHKKIFRAIKELIYENQTIDAVVVNARLERKNDTDLDMFTYLTELSDIVPSAAIYQGYMSILERDMILRRLIDACNSIVKESYEGGDAKEILASAEKRIYDIGQTYQRGSLEPIAKASGELIENMSKMCKDKSSMKGLMTHFPKFDSITNGLQRSDLIILAARPSVGKTSFALNIVSNIIDAGENDKLIAIFSLEMSSVQLVKRLFSNLTNVTMNTIGKGLPSVSEQEELWAVNSSLSSSKVYVDETGMQGPSEIIAKCRRLSNTEKRPLDLIVIDYLGLMKSDSNRRNDSKSNEVGEISRMLKLAAKELQCPVILICQMSRGIEGRDDKTPKLSDLRDSGSIEQDADLVLFLSRENEKEKGKPEYNVILDISKHRNGELGEIRYNWEGQHVKFIEATDQYINRELPPQDGAKHKDY